MKNIKKYVSLFCMAVSIMGCETTELEILQSPNQLEPSQASPDLLLNNVQTNLATFFEEVTEEGMEVTRMLHMFGPDYFTAYGPGQYNTPWSRAYATILSDIDNVLLITEGRVGFEKHRGMAKIMEAYVILTLVDYFGEVPYEQSNLGAANVNPEVNSGESIYAAAEQLLIEAKADLNSNPDSFDPQDLFYPRNDQLGPDVSRWTTLANTLLLKLYLQTSLVDSGAAAKINAVLAEGVMDSADEDFQFLYSTTDQNPDSRHPIFSRNYDQSPADYMSNSYMNLLLNDKADPDPRLRYYFYRQTSNAGNATQAQLPCINQTKPTHYSSDDVFCFLQGTGYWGRDHGNSANIPPDNSLRTTWGLYPVGGLFDDDSFQTVNDRGLGGRGAGISPIMLSSFSKFMQAEAALRLGTMGDPMSLMLDGIQDSFDKVIGFIPDVQDEDLVPTSDDIEAYLDEVEARYTSASSDDERLNIIIKEYYIALYGNGVEAYNTYRRTGKPDDLQPTITLDPSTFIRSFLYPANAVQNNSSLSQKTTQAIPVFWDTNPDGFVE